MGIAQPPRTDVPPPTVTPAPFGGDIAVEQIVGAESVSEQRQQRLDWVAALIAIALLSTFSLASLLPLFFWLGGKGLLPHELIDYAKHAASTAGTLLAVAIGFYFAKERLAK